MDAHSFFKGKALWTRLKMNVTAQRLLVQNIRARRRSTKSNKVDGRILKALP